MLYIERIVNLHTPTAGDAYPFVIPAIRTLRELRFRAPVTFIVGENGSGKSTLVEAIAVNAGFNPEGGSRNFHFSTNATHSDLYNELRIVRGPYRNRDGYFLRAESMYNVATEVDKIAAEDSRMLDAYGNRSLHQQSHGESFLALFLHRFDSDGLYIFDEPEAALSLKSMFAMMIRMRELVGRNSQFIIATHSPILLAFPEAEIYAIGENGIEKTSYEQTEQYRVTKYFLNNHREMLKELLE